MQIGTRTGTERTDWNQKYRRGTNQKKTITEHLMFGNGASVRGTRKCHRHLFEPYTGCLPLTYGRHPVNRPKLPMSLSWIILQRIRHYKKNLGSPVKIIV